MYYKLNGTFDLGGGDSITDPYFERIGTNYDDKKETALVIVRLWIEGQKIDFIRTFEFPCQTEWGSGDATDAMLSLVEFQNYSVVE